MDGNRYEINCELNYEANGPAAFILNIAVPNNQFQRVVNEAFTTNPNLNVAEASTSKKRHHRFTSDAGTVSISYRATVDLLHHVRSPEGIKEVAPGDLPPEVIPYLYPSRYCESDKIPRLTMQEFGNLQPGFSRVTAVCNWIRSHVEYLRGTTNPSTSAFDTVTERVGVCRDFAHLAITFCRALAIPARFAAGYAYGLEPGDFHAYFEAWLGDRWYIFDPSRLAPQTGLIRISTGRDAADTSFATIFGPVTFSSMKISVAPANNQVPQYTVDAISTDD